VGNGRWRQLHGVHNRDPSNRKSMNLNVTSFIQLASLLALAAIIALVVWLLKRTKNQ
jgi:flagellar biogenesis protein FliO